MHGNQAYSSLLLVTIWLTQLASPTGADAECMGSGLDCAAEPAVEWLALGSLSLVLSGAAGGLLAFAWHFIVAGVARREERSKGGEPRLRGASPSRGRRPSRAVATIPVERPVSARVILGPVWSDGHWSRMVTSGQGGQRLEILRSDGWETSDCDISRLLTEALPRTTLGRTRPPHPSR